MGVYTVQDLTHSQCVDASSGNFGFMNILISYYNPI